MLRKSHGIASWVLNFNDALSTKIIVGKIMKRLDEIRSLTEVIDPTEIQAIKDASVIHIPGVTRKDELETFISVRELMRRKKGAFRSPHIYLCLEKRDGICYMSIIEDSFRLGDLVEIKHVRYELDREQVSLLLYKLSRHGILSLNSWSRR
ncbi:Hypothetical protein BQ3484_287 [Cedratvirus A11]|uniref:Uncharacterized protein n=1 Tax=Cedratvirus A11 TaxID=1903266 RepID=A0A1M7XUI6_9VIRU|nr:Hypothetical protein BQ3484_287 [Cedratvirus A11]SHO33355.1 Hypothetical protein BQ3484_287 [Cedratvirus A11]